jgi:hypothetical protein
MAKKKVKVVAKRTAAIKDPPIILDFAAAPGRRCVIPMEMSDEMRHKDAMVGFRSRVDGVVLCDSGLRDAAKAKLYTAQLLVTLLDSEPPMQLRCDAEMSYRRGFRWIDLTPTPTEDT